MDDHDSQSLVDNQPLDLTALDPTLDALRWQRTITNVVARAAAARQRNASLANTLVSNGRYAVALAAAAAGAVWIGAQTRANGNGAATPISSVTNALEAGTDTQLADRNAWSRWALADSAPSSDLLYILPGGSDE